ncbi:hypothetical protein [uncultured Chryseobacterium sp.]|uniref:hypothetical protein n=1 Tax=uncultured Chryseobacterium sp. TaxID=259322 RepID=UPI0025F824EE|nr:hypothetical protein [uncultured Chryseobacterium sp.]
MKKIYYFPGLISALIVPVLFWHYINPYINKTKYNVVDIGLPAKLTKENYQYSFEPYRNWKYKKIVVQPNTALQNQPHYVSELKKLQAKNEKETGIEFILENNTYGDFVSLLNDMAIAKQETYALDLENTGHLFAVVNYIDPTAKEPEYKCLLCDDVIDSYESYSPDISFRFQLYCQSLFTDLPKLPEGAYYILFGFLLFLNISMLSIKENFQIKRNTI